MAELFKFGLHGQPPPLDSLGHPTPIRHRVHDQIPGRSWKLRPLESAAPTPDARHRDQDTGVVCSLLGIRSVDHLKTHPLRGAIFESWVAGELLKARVHRGLPADLKHYRESREAEIDLVVEDGLTLHAIECKSGATIHPSFQEPLDRFSATLAKVRPKIDLRPAIVYGGESSSPRRTIPFYSWKDVETLGRAIAQAP